MLQTLTGTTALVNAGTILNLGESTGQEQESDTKSLAEIQSKEPFWNGYRLGLMNRAVSWTPRQHMRSAKHETRGPANRRRRHASLHVKTKRMSLRRTKTGFRKRRTAAKRAERMNSTKRHHA